MWHRRDRSPCKEHLDWAEATFSQPLWGIHSTRGLATIEKATAVDLLDLIGRHPDRLAAVYAANVDPD
jgi:hypothetical protein